MSHFTVLVTNTNKRALEKQLAPFDENLELPLHIYKTRQDLIEEERKLFEITRKNYLEYLKDPEAYKNKTTNENHIKYLENEVPAMMEWTDDDFHAKAIKYYDNHENEDGTITYKDENDSAYIDKEGNLWSNWNVQPKWDWYTVGGRWAGFFKAKAGAEDTRAGDPDFMTAVRIGAGVEKAPEGVDVIKVKDIDWEAMDQEEKERRAKLYDEYHGEGDKPFVWDTSKLESMTREEYINQPISHITHAVLHRGKWYERGEMGWWGVVTNESPEEQWDKQFKSLLETLDPETEVTIVDCHI